MSCVYRTFVLLWPCNESKTSEEWFMFPSKMIAVTDGEWGQRQTCQGKTILSVHASLNHGPSLAHQFM